MNNLLSDLRSKCTAITKINFRFQIIYITDRPSLCSIYIIVFVFI